MSIGASTYVGVMSLIAKISGAMRCAYCALRGLIAMFFLPMLCGCSNCDETVTPPLSFPFEIQKAGSRIETELIIVEEKEYRFALQFFFKEEDESDRLRVGQLVGGAGVDKNGKLIDPGIPVLLQFKIYAIDSVGESSILEQKISELRLTATGVDSFTKEIIYVVLKPGHYRVSVESLRDVPEFQGTPINFQIAFYSKL